MESLKSRFFDGVSWAYNNAVKAPIAKMSQITVDRESLKTGFVGGASWVYNNAVKAPITKLSQITDVALTRIANSTTLTWVVDKTVEGARAIVPNEDRPSASDWRAHANARVGGPIRPVVARVAVVEEEEVSGEDIAGEAIDSAFRLAAAREADDRAIPQVKLRLRKFEPTSPTSPTSPSELPASLQVFSRVTSPTEEDEVAPPVPTFDIVYGYLYEMPTIDGVCNFLKALAKAAMWAVTILSLGTLYLAINMSCKTYDRCFVRS